MKTDSMKINEEYKQQKKEDREYEKNKRDIAKAIARANKPKKSIKKTKPDKKKLNMTTLLKKYYSGEKLFKYEETYMVSKLIAKADIVFGKFIRTRDSSLGCVSHGVKGCSNKVEQCCHWIGRAFYSHRWDERNCHGGCVFCNYYGQEEHKIYFTRSQVEKYGIERVNEQLKNKHKKKPSIKELLEIIEKYN